MNNKKFTIPVSIVCVVLGFLIAIQFRTSQKNNNNGVLDSNDIENNIDRLTQKEEELKSVNAELKDKVSSLEEQAAEANEEGQKIKDMLIYERVNLGIIDVTGDGILITIKPKNTMFSQNNKDSSKPIDSSNLVKIVDALWFGGAEAISINDIRLTIQTGISTSGSEILVGSGGKISSADNLTIKAIGDYEKMKNNLSKEFSVISNSNLVQNYDIDLKNAKDMVIEKATQSIISDHLYDIHTDATSTSESDSNKSEQYDSRGEKEN